MNNRMILALLVAAGAIAAVIYMLNRRTSNVAAGLTALSGKPVLPYAPIGNPAPTSSNQAGAMFAQNFDAYSLMGLAAPSTITGGAGGDTEPVNFNQYDGVEFA